MTARWPVRRPTEDAAVRAASRSTRRRPPIPALFAALLDAYALGDRHGVNLCAHSIARPPTTRRESS